jgi:predicted metalloprotease
MARADGTIFFGLQYLKRLLARAESPDAVVAEVCGHEFAHVAQYKHRLRDVLLAGQTNSRRLELRADFLAGYFAGMRKLERRDYPAAVFAAAAHAAGDLNVGGKSHHGTPDERAAAVVRGFEAAYRERQPFQEAMRAGVTYVSAL